MQSPRHSVEFGAGVTMFIQFAADQSAIDGMIICPCKSCANRFWSDLNTVHEHLICEGFMSGYSTWIHHGESVGLSEPPIQPNENTGQPSDHEEYS